MQAGFLPTVVVNWSAGPEPRGLHCLCKLSQYVICTPSCSLPRPEEAGSRDPSQRRQLPVIATLYHAAFQRATRARGLYQGDHHQGLTLGRFAVSFALTQHRPNDDRL
jgi:hypothetical protein